MKCGKIHKMFDVLRQTNKIMDQVEHLDDLKAKRREIQDQLEDVVKQLRVNESKYESILEMRMEGILNMSDEQVQNFIDERILPLRKEKQELKKELSELSETINKTDNLIREHQNKEREI